MIKSHLITYATFNRKKVDFFRAFTVFFSYLKVRVHSGLYDLWLLLSFMGLPQKSCRKTSVMSVFP